MLWEQSGAWEVSDGNVTISDDVDASTWDDNLSSLLNMEGRGRFFQDRLTVYPDGDTRDARYADGVGLMLSDSYEATYPGGQSYTLGTGFLSLYGGQRSVSWSAENGTRISRDRTLPAAYETGLIPSMSYGLHVGSVYPEMPPSLVLGGYDSSRLISDPIVSDTDTFTLNTMGLSSVGGYQYYGEPEPNDNQLSSPGMEVTINPGAPYMYLPRETCDRLAEFLPVIYNEDFNLYTWDKSGDFEAFESIVTTLHFLTFGFASSNNRTQEINVPFALLNLTLESPLVSEPTPYFPCSPLQDGQQATLGRSFLQAAFLGQNWQSERLFLAQAPGPDGGPENVQAIANDDRLLTPATNAPSWISTWSSTVPPWKDPSSDGDGGLSGGVLAGIVVGVIALLVIVAGLALWLFRRRKQRQSWTKPTESPGSLVELSGGSASRGAVDKEVAHAYYKPNALPVEIYEAEARPPAQEMDSSQQIGELPADRWSRNVSKY